MIAENIFSHTDLYERPKLATSVSAPNTDKIVIHNLASITGRVKPIWVFGILTQREDTHYYLEDYNFSIRIRFDELKYVDPNCYMTEGSVLLCNGNYQDDKFVVKAIEMPPKHASKSLKFKQNEADYFGAYGKVQR
jgi:hypothetical protein